MMRLFSSILIVLTLSAALAIASEVTETPLIPASNGLIKSTERQTPIVENFGFEGDAFMVANGFGLSY